MAGPPDDRTRRLDPTPPAGSHREPAYGEEDPRQAHSEILDRVRSLQRWLAVIGLIALAGLGVALYSVLSEDEEGDGRGASRQSVRDLRERVEAVEEDVDDRATKNSVSELRDQQEALDERVGEVSEQAGDGSAAAEAQQAAEELRTAVEDLQQRVEEVEQQNGESGSP